MRGKVKCEASEEEGVKCVVGIKFKDKRERKEKRATRSGREKVNTW